MCELPPRSGARPPPGFLPGPKARGGTDGPGDASGAAADGGPHGSRLPALYKQRILHTKNSRAARSQRATGRGHGELRPQGTSHSPQVATFFPPNIPLTFSRLSIKPIIIFTVFPQTEDSAELCRGSRSRGRVRAPGTKQRWQVAGTPATPATPASRCTPVCAAGSVRTSPFCWHNNPARHIHYTCPAGKEAKSSTGLSDLPRATRRGGQAGPKPTSQPGF